MAKKGDDKPAPAPKGGGKKRTVEVILLAPLVGVFYHLYSVGEWDKIVAVFKRGEVSPIITQLGTALSMAAPNYGFWLFIVIGAYVLLAILRRIF